MHIPSDSVTTAPRDAATVIILRDGTSQLEVFLVRRHGSSDVLGGAHVFPGGKLDTSDLALDRPRHLDLSDAKLHSRLAEAQLSAAQAAGLHVAALREAFEECGLLFAQGPGHGHGQQLAQQLRRGHSFNQGLASLDLRLCTHALLPWSRWITPPTPSVSSKRFDTRFFVAALPAGQTPIHDNVETTESVWLSPKQALQRYWAGEMVLAPPQIMTLAHLARFADAGSVLQAARNTPPPLITPEPLDVAGQRVLCYPGDPRHSVARRAMPGPTRLWARNQRFEPEHGFGDFFT